MKRLLAILLICAAAVTGTFIGTSLANQQVNAPAKSIDNTAVNDDTAKMLQETKNLLQQVKDMLSKKEDVANAVANVTSPKSDTITNDNNSTSTDVKPKQQQNSSVKSISTQSDKIKSNNVKQDTKQVVESNNATTNNISIKQDNRNEKPIIYYYYKPQTYASGPKPIPLSVIDNDYYGKKGFFNYIMENMVGISTIDTIRNMIKHRHTTSYFDLNIKYEQDNKLVENARQELGDVKQQWYEWSKVRLLALEHLKGFVNTDGGYGNIALKFPEPAISEKIIDYYIPNSYSEVQLNGVYIDTGRDIKKIVTFLLDDRFWVMEQFWKPWTQEPTDAGDVMEFKIIGDTRLNDLTDSVIYEYFKYGYPDIVDTLITQLRKWRKVDYKKVDPNELPPAEYIDKELMLSYSKCYTDNLEIEQICIEPYRDTAFVEWDYGIDYILKKYGWAK